MMPRVPEPELMGDAAQALACASADFAGVNRDCVSRFRQAYPAFREGHIVDLGRGPGDIPVRLCKALPSVRVTGVDGADEIRSQLEAAGLAHLQLEHTSDRHITVSGRR